VAKSHETENLVLFAFLAALALSETARAGIPDFAFCCGERSPENEEVSESVPLKR